MIRSSMPILGLTLALAACGGPPATPPVANNAAEAENVAVAAAPPAPKPLASLPEAYQGRWGATPADCQGTGGIGRAVITANGMTFFGVTAKANHIVEVRPDVLKADLAFTNRKGNWSSPTTMTLRDDGKTLVREDTHPSGRFTYQRCAS